MEHHQNGFEHDCVLQNIPNHILIHFEFTDLVHDPQTGAINPRRLFEEETRKKLAEHYPNADNFKRPREYRGEKRREVINES